MIEFKLPANDFFADYAKNQSILNFGKESRDISLSYVKKFDTVIDIGAHAGISVIHWAKNFKNVHAFEPMLNHYECLKENTKHLTNVNLYNVAISNTNKTLKGAYRTEKNSGSFQILDDSYTQPNKKTPRQIYEIKSRCLDDFNFDAVDLIKVDVEGWEYEALLSAKKTILKHRPVLMIEFTGGNSKKSLHTYNIDDYNNLLNELKYKSVASAGDDTIYIPE